MPSNDSSKTWHIVLHQSQIVEHGSVEHFAKTHPFVKVVCFEPADKTVKRNHYHLACLSDDTEDAKTRKVLQLTLKKAFPGIAGKADYTLHLPKAGEDDEGLLRYICKGTPDVKPTILYNSIFIDTDKYHLAYYEKQKEFKSEAKRLAEKKITEAMLRKSEVVATLILNYKGYRFTESTVRKVSDDIQDAFKGGISTHDTVIMINRVLHATDPEGQKNAQFNLVYRKMFPN